MTLKVTSFSSKGRVTRISSSKCKEKIVHLQSDNQLRLFLMLEWDEDVVDIKVNVELNDLEKNLSNIDNLRLDKFKDKKTEKQFLLHTNFLVSFKRYRGIEELTAISVKSTSELKRKTVIEKLEIERRYWEAKGVRFAIITEKEIDRQMADNILWVREMRSDKSLRNKEELAEKLYYLIEEKRMKRVNEILQEFDKREDIKEGTGLFLFRYLIADKQIVVNMKKCIDLSEKINKLITF
ncbi:TnsA endonuclease C-terminal domain-containing protein [Clostridium gasigenes]|uniref:TnsA endonuclease N terminal n=1 Tax=Clostridium gasigenes TaxID=94869 RepID=A0A1H0S2F1_9CLOT|nr:TnsA endonuclease C-terminal domain-containing protein [Clostridium gasigenes]SDP35779.1 TnsA endonuclease N terminal [Clostridium gasigenes]